MTLTDPDIAWLTDDTLEPLPHAQSVAPTGLLGQLLQAGSAHERQALLRAALHTVGFDWLAYGRVRLHEGVLSVSSFLPTYADPQWTERYFDQRFYEVDVRHTDTPPSGLPRAWAADDIVARSSQLERQERDREFARALRDSGHASGVFMSVALPGGRHERAVVSMSSSAAQGRWISHSVLAQSALLAFTVHEFVGLHVVRGMGEVDGLDAVSPVQRAILRGLAQGQSDREISERLQMSAHTVDYHLRCLRRRFAARNRAQLVCAAMEAGGSVP
jgi:DNA-binding CsgD family transcriptional regulator